MPNKQGKKGPKQKGAKKKGGQGPSKGDKGKKRAWRKADIKNVEDDIEDMMLVKKMKISKNSHTDNDDLGDDLFTVDTKGTSEGLSRLQRRELARAKLFPVKDKGEGLSLFEQDKIDRAESKKGRAKASKDSSVFDLWGQTQPHLKGKEKAAVECSTIKRFGDKARPVMVPGTMHQKLGLAPAVIPAHEGQSMNPETGSYEDLAYLAAATQLEKEEADEELERKMRPMTAELRDKVPAKKLKEMTEEEKLKLYRSLVCKDGGVVEDEEGEYLRTKLVGLKTQSTKNKKGRRKVFEEKSRQEVAQRKLDKSVGAVGTILKEMEEHDELMAQKKQYRKTLRSQNEEIEKATGRILNRRKVGGRNQFSESNVVLPEAGAGKKGLRSVPLKASAIQDRMDSILRRGMLPARQENSGQEMRRQLKKNARVKSRRKFLSPLMRDNLLLR